MWWNFSITALESFLINNDFLSEKVPCGTRGISILSSFCDHFFLLNSLAWRGKKPPWWTLGASGPPGSQAT
jgi:hypothetical protein